MVGMEINGQQIIPQDGWYNTSAKSVTLTNSGWQTATTVSLGKNFPPGKYALSVSIGIPLSNPSAEIILDWGYGLTFVVKGTIWTTYVVNSIGKFNTSFSSLDFASYSSALGGSITVSYTISVMRLL